MTSPVDVDIDLEESRPAGMVVAERVARRDHARHRPEPRVRSSTCGAPIGWRGGAGRKHQREAVTGGTAQMTCSSRRRASPIVPTQPSDPGNSPVTLMLLSGRHVPMAV